MADYIYTMEIRLTPDQVRAVSLVTEAARAQGMNVYLTGGTMRDLLTGLPIRDIDLTVQGNPVRLQKELEKSQVRTEYIDDHTNSISLTFPGGVRGEIEMAHVATYDKPGKPPAITPAGIAEDLRRRDFTVNAMALSLNEGSKGLLLDPSNGAADVEAKLLRVLHNYAFLEEPVRLIRATRFLARFHWQMEERTQARYDAAKENNYIEYISNRAVGDEVEQLAYEDDPLGVMRALEKEDWLKVLHPHWSVAKVDATGLQALLRTRQQLAEMGVEGSPAAAVMYFLTAKLTDKEIAELQRMIPNKTLVEKWRSVEEQAKELSKRLTSKEAAMPSGAWKVLSEARPETLMFLSATVRQQTVEQKIKNYFTKWRQVKDKLPLPEMTELRITPSLANYQDIADQVFRLLLDGKLHTHTETMKFLQPYSPPLPPPPQPTRRGRAAKAEAGALAAAAAGAGKKAAAKAAAAPAAPATAPSQAPAKPALKGRPATKKAENQQTKPTTSAPPAKKPATKPAKKAKKTKK